MGNDSPDTVDVDESVPVTMPADDHATTGNNADDLGGCAADSDCPPSSD